MGKLLKYRLDLGIVLKLLNTTNKSSTEVTEF